MKALWDPESGRLLSLCCSCSIHKEGGWRKRWEDKKKWRVESNNANACKSYKNIQLKRFKGVNLFSTTKKLLHRENK